MAKPLIHHRRKLSNATPVGNGLSFSGKDAYDDVFSGGLKPKFGAAAAAPPPAAASGFRSRRVAAEDYAEIFGGKNGTRGSSIPVLDLAELDGRNGGSSDDDYRSSGRKMDYSMIFGGGDDVPPAPVPAYEELFSGVKKAKRNEAKARIPSGNGSPLKGSDRFSLSDDIRSNTGDAPDQSLDGGKQFNMSYHKTGERRINVPNGTTHIAQLNAVPGFTCVIDETARVRETQLDKAMPHIQAGVSHSQRSSDYLQKTEQDKAMPPVKVELNTRSAANDLSDTKFGTRNKWQVSTSKSSEGLVKHKVEYHKDADYQRDKFRNSDDVGHNSHRPKEPSPSSSSANQIDSKGQPKQTNIPSFGSKIEASEVGSGYATPFSDEELDVNSAAAASIEALKKAIEQAQESIRIAKEKMERKSRPRDSLKASGRSESNYAQEANNAQEKNVKEACKIPENKVHDSIELDQEIPWGSGFVSGFTQKEEPATGRQAVAETNHANVEVYEDNGVATWFTQLLTNGKQKMAALASELVVKKNSVLQHTDKDVDDVQEIRPAKVTSVCDTTAKVNSGDRVCQFGNTDTELNVLGRSEELKKNMDYSDSLPCLNEHKPSDSLIFAEKGDATNNRKHDLDKEEGGNVKPESCSETFSDIQFELPEVWKVFPENDSLKVHNSLEQEAGDKVEDFSLGDENDGRVGEVENDNKKQEEFHLGVKNEDDEPKMATDSVRDEKRQEGDLRQCLDGYDKQESGDHRLAESVEGEGSLIISEEDKVQEGIERKHAEPHKNEEEGCTNEHADDSSLCQRREVNDELQESVANPRGHFFKEFVHEQGSDETSDVDVANESANSVGFQDTCRPSVENISEQTGGLGIRNSEEKGDLSYFTEESSRQECGKNEGVAGNVGISECMQDLDGDAKTDQSVEEASSLAGEHILETSSTDHVDAEEVTMKRVMQDFPDATASGSGGNTATFDFINMVHESSQSKGLGTDGCSNNGIDPDVIDDLYATDGSAASNPSTLDVNDLNLHTQIHENDRDTSNIEDVDRLVHEVYGQNRIEESDRESESSTNPEYGDGFVHESNVNAEYGSVDGIECQKEIEKDNIEMCQKEPEWVQNEKESEGSHFSGEEDMESNSDGKTDQSSENYEENVSKIFLKEAKEARETSQKEEVEKDEVGTSEVKKRNREQERDRMAVERAIREARERAFAEAREWAERAAVEKATAEVRQRAMAEAREKLEKVSSGPKLPVDKASIAAKLRAERAAVERATAEARGRALEKALSQKTTSETRTQSERDAAGKSSGASRDAGIKHSFSSSDLENFDARSSSESAQRRKARLERHQRIMERAAKALAEKNLRDVLAQREQAQKNKLADTLDAEIKRWASGKEGNLRALLSTLQYILGPGSGWQPISLTEIVTTAAVKKAYRKATLYVHPDKLQQRGASIQQKYICEKVFDLLKAAWNKFNSEER